MALQAELANAAREVRRLRDQQTGGATIPNPSTHDSTAQGSGTNRQIVLTDRAQTKCFCVQIPYIWNTDTWAHSDQVCNSLKRSSLGINEFENCRYEEKIASIIISTENSKKVEFCLIYDSYMQLDKVFGISNLAELAKVGV